MRNNNVLYDPKISQLDFLVTERCNLSCVYCFHKQRPLDMADEVVNKAIYLLKDQFRENVIFNFFGGEPIIREEFCLDLMHKLRDMFPKCRFHFTTNGTVYSKRLVDEFLIKEDPILQLSHDGVNQEALRGKESLVTRNLRKYIDAIGPSRVMVRLTYTHDTVGDLSRNVEYFYKMGVRRFAHQADVTNQWEDTHISEYYQQLDLIYNFIKIHHDMDVIFCNCNRAIRNSVKDRQCSMGKELLALSASGDIFPCHRAVKFPQFKIGNVFEGYINRGKFPVLYMHGCGECFAKSLCHQCYIANYEQNRFLELPVRSGCAINRYEYKKICDTLGLLLEDSGYVDDMCNKIMAVLEDISSGNKIAIEELNG